MSKTKEELRKELKTKEKKENKERKQKLAFLVDEIKNGKFRTTVNGKKRKLGDIEIHRVINFLSESHIHFTEDITDQLHKISDSNIKDILYFIEHEGWKEPAKFKKSRGTL